MSKNRVGILFVIAALALLTLGACSKSDNGKTVNVALGDFSLQPQASTIAAGDITFKVHNNGGFEHEMVVFKVADASRIPSQANGEADEEAVPKAAHMGEVEHVLPGTSKTFKLKLSRGKYVLFCNLIDGTKAHFKEGMHAQFTVTG